MRVRAAHALGVEELDGVVYVAPLPGGPILVLEGTAAMIWSAALEDGSDVVGLVARIVGCRRSEIRDDVDRFLQSLVSAGVLVEVR